jgi:hypothetical protein
MRIRPLIVVAFLPATASAAQPAAPASAPPARADARTGEGAWCDNQTRLRHAGEDARGEARRLDRLPPGSLYHAVWRQHGQCVGPVLVREGYGATVGKRRR